MPGPRAQRLSPLPSPPLLQTEARPATLALPSRLPPSDAKRWLASLPLLPLGLAALVALLPAPVDAALSTFQISTPRQCGPLTLNWTTPSGSVAGSDEPFNLVLIPTSDQNEVLSNLTFTSSSNRCVSRSANARLFCQRGPEKGRKKQKQKRGASAGRPA
jgi:hypothetical protein